MWWGLSVHNGMFNGIHGLYPLAVITKNVSRHGQHILGQGFPISGIYYLIIWGRADVKIIEIKYTINVTCLNPQTIPTPVPWKHCLLWNSSLVSKRLGAAVLGQSFPYKVKTANRSTRRLCYCSFECQCCVWGEKLISLHEVCVCVAVL